MGKRILRIIECMAVCYPVAVFFCFEVPIWSIWQSLWMALVVTVLFGMIRIGRLVISYKKVQMQVQESENVLRFSFRARMSPTNLARFSMKCRWHELYVCIHGVCQPQWKEKYISALPPEDQKSLPGERPGTETIVLRTDVNRLFGMAIPWDELESFSIQEPSVPWDDFLESCNREGPVGSPAFYLHYVKNSHEAMLMCTPPFAQTVELSAGSLYDIWM